MWPNPQISADLVTFTEEIVNEKFFYRVNTDFLSILKTYSRME